MSIPKHVHKSSALFYRPQVHHFLVLVAQSLLVNIEFHLDFIKFFMFVQSIELV